MYTLELTESMKAMTMAHYISKLHDLGRCFDIDMLAKFLDVKPRTIRRWANTTTCPSNKNHLKLNKLHALIFNNNNIQQWIVMTKNTFGKLYPEDFYMIQTLYNCAVIIKEYYADSPKYHAYYYIGEHAQYDFSHTINAYLNMKYDNKRRF